MKETHINLYLKMARTWAERSKISTTKVGCILVAKDDTFLCGFNGPPRGFNDELLKDLSRNHSRSITTHAEVNAIANAARSGFSTVGTIAIVTHPVCSSCMSALINAGIIEVIYTGSLHPDWISSVELGIWLANQCNIPVTILGEDDDL